jgi:hypothetical protein
LHLYLLNVLTPRSRVLYEKLTGLQLGKKFPALYGNQKVHYRNHKCPPPVSILSQLSPVHTLTSHLLKIHLNIILPSKPASPQWSLSLRFPHQNPVHASPFSQPSCMSHPSHSKFKYFFQARIWDILIRDIVNHLSPELNPSAQRCLTRFFYWGILLLEPCISLIYA